MTPSEQEPMEPTEAIGPVATLPEPLPVPETEAPRWWRTQPKSVPAPQLTPQPPAQSKEADPRDHPRYMHPDAPDLPKHVTLHRADAYPTQQKQSVIVLPDEQEGHTTAHRQGPTVAHAMKAALIPDGYALLSPKTGQKLDPEDDLYEHVSHGDTVEVVRA